MWRVLCGLPYDIGKVEAGFDGVGAQAHHHCKLLLRRKEALHCSHPAATVNQKPR